MHSSSWAVTSGALNHSEPWSAAPLSAVFLCFQVKDETWEAYYKERSALEYRFRSETRKPEALASAADAGAEDNQQPEEVEGVPLPWEHDWPQPKLPNICTESYTEEPHKDLKELHERIAARLASILRGCPSLKDRAQLEKNIKSSFYIVSYW